MRLGLRARIDALPEAPKTSKTRVSRMRTPRVDLRAHRVHAQKRARSHFTTREPPFSGSIHLRPTKKYLLPFAELRRTLAVQASPTQRTLGAKLEQQMKNATRTTQQSAFFRHVTGCPCICAACLGLIVSPAPLAQRAPGFVRAVRS